MEEGLDAVLIATPNDLHLPYTEYFAARGKHIICEKPAALTSGYFEMMTDAAKAGGVLLIVHQNRRWDPDFLTVKQLKAEGTIGEIYDIESCVTGSHGIPLGLAESEGKGRRDADGLGDSPHRPDAAVRFLARSGCGLRHELYRGLRGGRRIYAAPALPKAGSAPR